MAAKHSPEAWLQGMALQSWITGWLAWLMQRFEWWSMLGLLSSSCCVLQLLLNAFSIGCAGFNAWLGPLRPFMLALTVTLQASMWRLVLSGRSPLLNAAAATALTVALSLLPEALHLYTRRHEPRLDAVTPPSACEVCFRVDGMGCTACTAKVQRTVELLPGVQSCRVRLEGGEARVVLDQMAATDERMSAALQRSVAAALRAAGFPAAPARAGAGDVEEVGGSLGIGG